MGFLSHHGSKDLQEGSLAWLDHYLSFLGRDPQKKKQSGHTRLQEAKAI